MSEQNYNDVLGVAQNATTEEIEKIYKLRAKAYHPDVLSSFSPETKRVSEQEFKIINAAHDTLKDEVKRKAYDETLAMQKQRAYYED